MSKLKPWEIKNWLDANCPNVSIMWKMGYTDKVKPIEKKCVFCWNVQTDVIEEKPQKKRKVTT